MKISAKSLSLHKITFISYIALAIIIVILMAMLVYTSIYPSLSDLTEDNLISEISYVSQSIETTLNKTLYSCELLAQNRELVELVKNYSSADYMGQFYIGNSIEAYLNDYWSPHLSVESAYLILPNNRITPQRNDYTYTESLEIMESVEWFKSIKGLSTAIVTRDAEDRNTSNYSKPTFITVLNQICDTNGTVIGYSAVNVSQRHFETNFYFSDHIVPDSYVYTLDNTGNIIYANTDVPISDFIDSSSLFISSAPKCIRVGKYSIISSEASKHGWKTVEITKSAPLYSKVNSVKYIATLMIFITLILGLLLSFILSRFTTMSVVKLADNMKSFLKSGKLKKMDNTYENEIGVIIKTYNNMVDHIERLMEEEKQHMHMRKQAELKMLQAQINPHFLYNTLDSISWRSIRSNVPEVGKLLNKLARLYQHSLYKGLDVHPLKNELEQIELYMTLQQECFNSEFIYDIDIEDELLKLYMPRFILQPIIENSILHGFGGNKAKGIIDIKGKVVENKLILTVSDNGNGIDFDILNRINNNGYKSERYGIINIKERIALICGDEYGLIFSSNDNLGTTVTYTLPACDNSEYFERR